jgi:hypothetical protein
VELSSSQNIRWTVPAQLNHVTSVRRMEHVPSKRRTAAVFAERTERQIVPLDVLGEPYEGVWGSGGRS